MDAESEETRPSIDRKKVLSRQCAVASHFRQQPLPKHLQSCVPFLLPLRNTKNPQHLEAKGVYSSVPPSIRLEIMANIPYNSSPVVNLCGCGDRLLRLGEVGGLLRRAFDAGRGRATGEEARKDGFDEGAEDDLGAPEEKMASVL